jgi:hypothetical protein
VGDTTGAAALYCEDGAFLIVQSYPRHLSVDISRIQPYMMVQAHEVQL